MDNSPSALERELAELRGKLRDLERRVLSLERVGAAGIGDGGPASDTLPTDGDVPRVHGDGSTRFITLAGRTFVLLGIGHLLRGLTDSGTVAPPLGIGLGLAYALSWVGATFRAVSRGRRRSAAAFALTASIIAFPLLWESVTRFGVLSVGLGALCAALLGLSFLFLAVRWGLHSFALVGVGGALAANLALSFTGRSVPVCAASVLGLSGVALWVSWWRAWRLLPWMTAAAANVATLGVILAAGSGKASLSPLHGVVFGLLLLILYLGSAMLRLRRSSSGVGSLSAFDIVQSATSMLVGYGGAVFLAHSSGQGTIGVVVVSLAAAAACYASSFGGWLGRELDRRSFSVFNTLALVLILAASALALPRPAMATLWAGLAIVGPVLCHRMGRATFAVHGGVSILAAAIASGLPNLAALVFTSAPEHAREAANPLPVWGVVFASALGLGAFGAPPLGPRRRRLAAMRLLYWSLLVVGTATIATRVLSPAVATGEAASANLGSLRTLVLAVVVTALGLVSLRRRLADAHRLVYPMLILVGLKLVVEDLPNGRPTNLFLSLGCFGASLIVAARTGARSRAHEETPTTR